MTVPAAREVQVHLFGPGYGECVLVHLGAGDWLVVDSCVPPGPTKAPAARAPAALSYLESIGVDPAVAIKVIVASHWHDDHVRGLSTIVKRCKAASFWCSRALFKKEFLTLTKEASARPMSRAGSGVDEFSAIVDELQARALATGKKLAGIGLNFAQANGRIWQRTVPADNDAEIFSLSPSDTEFTLALTLIARMFKVASGRKKRARRRITSVRPNNTAIALQIRVRDVHLLLGADLEEIGMNFKTGTPPYLDCGWQAVVASPSRPRQKSALFKVAHHGSRTAHNDDVWTDMLVANPLAIMTPFRKGSVRLPEDRDVARLGTKTDALFITARNATKRAKPSNPVVARAFAATAKEIWEAAAMGHIRATLPEGATTWKVETLSGATRL